ASNQSLSQLSTAAASSAGAPPARVWQILEANIASAPHVTRAATDLKSALRRGVRGTVRSGSFFQAALAPTCAGWLPESLRRAARWRRSEEHTSELQSRENLVCRLL